MAANKSLRVGPIPLLNTAVPSATLNLLNAAVATMTGTNTVGTLQPYIILRHIRIVNKHASIAATFSLWLGGSGLGDAGKEFMGTGTPVPVGSAVDWYGALRMESADFLVGNSNTATALTFEAEGEIGIAG